MLSTKERAPYLVFVELLCEPGGEEQSPTPRGALLRRASHLAEKAAQGAHRLAATTTAQRAAAAGSRFASAAAEVTKQVAWQPSNERGRRA